LLTKSHAGKWNAELATKQQSRYYCHRNVAFKFTQIEFSGLPHLEKC